MPIIYKRGGECYFNPMPASLTRDQMRLYQRERRARLKAEREASEPLVDAAIPPGALLKESPEDMARIWAKVDAIGPGAVITKAGGRLDVVRREDVEEARSVPPPARLLPDPPPPPSRPPAPPRSMPAVGGVAGKGRALAGYDPTFAPHDGLAVEWQINAATMLSTMAAKIDQQDRRLAALEAEAAARRARRANTANLTHAVLGLFGFAVRP
jgi:hypothetical protein